MQSKKSPIAGTLVTFLFLFSIVTPALAVSWTDVGDAGNTPATAQTPLGAGALNSTIGNLSAAVDTDVFRIYVSDPGIFSITMNGTNLTGDDDAELYVLDALGNLLFNNDDGGPGWLSQVNAGASAGQPGGVYPIAYNLFSSYPTTSQLNPVTGWTVNPFGFQTGPVQLNLSGAEFVPEAVARTVPEPSSFLLLGFGLVGVGFASRRLTNRRL